MSSPSGPVPGGCGRPPVTDLPGAAEVLEYRADLAAVRGFAASWGNRAGLSPERVGDLVIVVGELTANTLAHTGGPGVLRLWVSGEEVICQVEDGGQITDPQAGMRRPDPAADDGHRGLWLVRRLCDRVEISTGPAGSTVRGHMQFDRRLADCGLLRIWRPDSQSACPGFGVQTQQRPSWRRYLSRVEFLSHG